MRLTTEETKTLEKMAMAMGADITRKPVGECTVCGEPEAVLRARPQRK